MVDTLSINGHPHQDEEKDEQQQQQQQDEKIVSQKKIRFSDEVVTVNGESGAEDLEGGMLEQKVSSSDSSPRASIVERRTSKVVCWSRRYHQVILHPRASIVERRGKIYAECASVLRERECVQYCVRARQERKVRHGNW